MKRFIERIIIITELPFTDRHSKIWGVNTLIQNGFSVEVWDISSFLYNSIFEISSPINEKNFQFKQKKFSSETEIIDAISNLSNVDFVNVFIGYYPKIFFIYKLISEKKINYAVPLFNTLPFSNRASIASPKETSRVTYIINLLKIDIKKFINKITNHWIHKNPCFSDYGIKSASVAIAGGTASLDDKQYPVDINTRILWTHSIDYNISLQNDVNHETGIKIPSNSGVFLDDYLPFHPDFKIKKIEPPLSPEEYYPKLCRFFSYLEKKYSANIIIAAHPTAKTEQLSALFEGRLVYQGMTAQLVKDSQFVMMHASTSINFAIIYRKPILFLTLGKLRKTGESSCQIGDLIQNMSLLLEKIPINLDEDPSINLDQELKIDIDAYNNYKDLHIKKKGSEERDMWQLFAEFIKENF